MRRLLLLIVCAFVGIAAQAEKVTEQEAKQIALQFVPQSLSRQTPGEKASDTPATIAYTYMMPQSNRAAFYIINVGEDAFVLVSEGYFHVAINSWFASKVLFYITVFKIYFKRVVHNVFNAQYAIDVTADHIA